MEVKFFRKSLGFPLHQKFKGVKLCLLFLRLLGSLFCVVLDLG
jgi:hypothetical protein